MQRGDTRRHARRPRTRSVHKVVILFRISVSTLHDGRRPTGCSFTSSSSITLETCGTACQRRFTADPLVTRRCGRDGTPTRGTRGGWRVEGIRGGIHVWRYPWHACGIDGEWNRVTVFLGKDTCVSPFHDIAIVAQSLACGWWRGFVRGRPSTPIRASVGCRSHSQRFICLSTIVDPTCIVGGTWTATKSWWITTDLRCARDTTSMMYVSVGLQIQDRHSLVRPTLFDIT
jgi:hypothetical protein